MGAEADTTSGGCARRWHAYFNVHGDPFVVTDPERPHFTTVATVATSPEDYGRANALLMAAAPEAVERLRTNHRVLVEDTNVIGNHTPSDCATCVFLALLPPTTSAS
jgi:hypothetical protein